MACDIELYGATNLNTAQLDSHRVAYQALSAFQWWEWPLSPQVNLRFSLGVQNRQVRIEVLVFASQEFCELDVLSRCIVVFGLSPDFRVI